jgi:hypothetical protein
VASSPAAGVVAGSSVAGVVASSPGAAVVAGSSVAGGRIARKPGIAAQRDRARSDASRRPASNGARTTPSSVTIPVMRSDGVMSKAGFLTSVPAGATRMPRNSRISSALRSSIGMAEPSGVPRSTELVGTQK